MRRAFATLVFTDAVKTAQARHGTRGHCARIEAQEPANNRLTDDLKAYIARLDSFVIATANRAGWPHAQHRGGPRGFLKILDDRTLGFADYAGNKQYITVGNIAENNPVAPLLIDYERRRRLKLWAKAEVVDGDPTLLRRLADPEYPARVEWGDPPPLGRVGP